MSLHVVLGLSSHVTGWYIHYHPINWGGFHKGYPQLSSILRGFSTIDHQAFGVPLFMEIHSITIINHILTIIDNHD